MDLWEFLWWYPKSGAYHRISGRAKYIDSKNVLVYIKVVSKNVLVE